jgi:hypothetical protein
MILLYPVPYQVYIRYLQAQDVYASKASIGLLPHTLYPKRAILTQCYLGPRSNHSSDKDLFTC